MEPRPRRSAPALLALTAGAFGIGVSEFVIMGLLLDVADDLHVSTSAAGLLISGYALGVVVAAPVLTIATAGWPRKQTLLALMGIFVAGNAACAMAPSYGWLMAARVLTASAHGSFFGVGSVVAARLVQEERQASAIAVMFTGLTVANVVGVPVGTWIGQTAGWRATFWVVALVGGLALLVIARTLPSISSPSDTAGWRSDLRALGRRPVLLGLLTTVLGYAGVFTIFTFIAPVLTRISGFAPRAISPILLLFGAGLVLGNLVGGHLADRAPRVSILATLTLLLATLLAAGPLLTTRPGALVFVILLGFAAFSTVAPLQASVLRCSGGAGESLVSSFNIAAFNLGNALGAWIGGATLSLMGIGALTWVAASFPALALLSAASRLSRHLPERYYPEQPA